MIGGMKLAPKPMDKPLGSTATCMQVAKVRALPTLIYNQQDCHMTRCRATEEK